MQIQVKIKIILEKECFVNKVYTDSMGKINDIKMTFMLA